MHIYFYLNHCLKRKKAIYLSKPSRDLKTVGKPNRQFCVQLIQLIVWVNYSFKSTKLKEGHTVVFW